MVPALPLSLHLPSSRSVRRAGVVLGVAALLLLSGCTVLGDTGLPDGETAADRHTSLDGYAGTAEITYTGPTDAENQSFEIVARPATGESRIELYEPPHRAGNVIVYNGTHVVRYNATEDELTRIALEDSDRIQRSRDRLRRLVDRASAGETGRVGISPFPIVPAADPGEEPNATRMKYSYAGTETVLGRQAYVIQIRPVNGTDGGITNRTLWLDAEWFVTLQANTVRHVDGERVTHHFRLTDIAFDPGLSDATFAFDPPPSTTTDETTSQVRSTYDSRAELEAATDLSVPDPALPDRFELERAGRTVGQELHHLYLFYHRGEDYLFVEKVQPDGRPTLADGEAITVGNRTGRYADLGLSARVAWTCDGVKYTVGGSLARDQIVTVAESVACE